MRRSVALASAVLLVALSCTPTPSSIPQGGSPDTPVSGGRIVAASVDDIKTLNPVLSSDVPSSNAWSLIYLPLTQANPDNAEIEPSVAQKFELSADGLTMTYTLRDGVVWSDGVPFTGDDYKYTAEAVMRSKRTVRKGTFENVVGAKDYQDGKTDSISGITVGDSGKTIQINFTKPFCPAVAQMGGAGAGGIIPKHSFLKYWDNKTTDATKNIDDNPLNMAPPASLGPFVYKEYVPGDRITFTRNDKYFKGAPLVDEFTIKVYADTNAIKSALDVGEVTYASVEGKDWEALGKNQNLKGYRFGGLGLTYLGWNAANPKTPWLADKRFRQALAYGLNIDQLIDKVLFGFGKRVYGYSVPLYWSYDEEGLNKYPYDPGKAKQLIESTGATMGGDGIYRWTNGQPISIRIEGSSGNSVVESTLQIAQEQYGKIGIKIDPQQVAFQTLTEKTRFGKPDWEGFSLGFSYGVDPDPYGIWHSVQAHATGFNRVGYKSADSVIEAQRNGPDCSIANRKKLIHQVDKMLNEDVPWTFLWAADTLVYAQASLRGFDPKPFSTASRWSIEKWWFRR
jgi:peptide/nickel transport system substrate-binding protein